MPKLNKTKIIFFVFLLLLVIGVLAGRIFLLTENATQKNPTFQDHQLTKINLNRKQLTVEIVKTPASLERGLSGRKEIGSDGMLFLLPETRIPTFWMKEMNFDLDLIWLRENRVVDISPNVPHPISLQSQLPLYSPSSPADMVLELPANKAQELEIHNGDQLEFVLP
jgi:uncharacterized membrane protein (UPF0127 family)